MTETSGLKYERKTPVDRLSGFVKCFWTLENTLGETKPVTILPDGYFDILFVAAAGIPFKTSLLGLTTKPTVHIVPANSRTFAVSFKLPAAEYVLKVNICDLIDKGKHLAEDFLGVACADIANLDAFANLATTMMLNNFGAYFDNRKRLLFHHIYQSEGNITVEQLSDLSFWNARQINRYFQNNFGLTLKTYCNILRFRASFDELHKGQLFPSQGYFDQPHFIREVHKFAGTSPKYLAKNKEDRFIQLSTLQDK